MMKTDHRNNTGTKRPSFLAPNIVERNKPEFFYSFIFLTFFFNYFFWDLSWILVIAILAALISIIFYYQWSIFQDAISRQRLTKKFLIVHTNTNKSLEMAKKVEKDAITKGMNPIIVSTINFDAFSILYQATAIVFVIDDSYNTANDPLFSFFTSEVIQRQRESAYYGFKENIVYTKEGCRRNAFLRVKYSVVSVPNEKYNYDQTVIPWNSFDDEIPNSYAIDNYMKEINAFQVIEKNAHPEKFEEWSKNFWDRLLSTIALSPQDSLIQEEPYLGFSYFLPWFFACPCCSQLELEKTRDRPSKFRTSFLGMILLAIKEESFRRVFVKQQVKGLKFMFLPRLIMRLYFEAQHYLAPLFKKKEEMSPVIDHSAPDQDAPVEESMNVVYENFFGDVELLGIFDKIGKDDYVQNILTKKTYTDLIINQGFAYTDKIYVSYPHYYIYEFISLNWKDEHALATIENPITKMTTFFQVGEERWKNILRDLKPGQAVDDNFLSQFSEKEKEYLIACRLIVPSNFEEIEAEKWKLRTKDTYNDLISKGYTLIENILDPILLSSLSKYNSGIFQYFGGDTKTSKWKTYNDEFVARYYQYILTDFMSKLIKRKIANSSLTLNIYIREGEGFEPHVDTSPPFDITLDIVTDHKGTGERPIYISRGTHDNWVPSVEKLELHLGQSALFIGSQLLHYGGYLNKGNYHNVTLFTYQYVD